MTTVEFLFYQKRQCVKVDQFEGPIMEGSRFRKGGTMGFTPFPCRRSRCPVKHFDACASGVKRLVCSALTTRGLTRRGQVFNTGYCSASFWLWLRRFFILDITESNMTNRLNDGSYHERRVVNPRRALFQPPGCCFFCRSFPIQEKTGFKKR